MFDAENHSSRKNRSERYKQPISPFSNTRIHMDSGGWIDVETASYLDFEDVYKDSNGDWFVWRTKEITICDHCSSEAKHNINGNQLCQSHAEEYHMRNMH